MARLQNFEDSAMSNVSLKMNPLLIVNPIAGTSLNSDLLPELLDVLKSQHLEVDIEETTPEEDGEQLVGFGVNLPTTYHCLKALP